MKAKLIAGAVGVIGITAFLYGKTQNVDLERNEEVRQALGRLAELSAGLSEDVLKLRCSLLMNYDSVTSAQRRSAAVLERLGALYAQPASAGEREIGSAILACRSVLVRKQTLAESFKSQSAVLENSLDYLPVLGYALATSDLGSPEAVRRVDDLLRDTLVYNRGARKEVVSRIRASIARLGELRPQLRPDHLRDLGFMTAHVETILQVKPSVDALLEQIAAVPVASRIEDLRRVISREYDDGVRSAAAYRRALLVLSASLLLAVAFTLAKLEQKASALSRANVDLQESVQAVAHKEAETRAIVEGAADGILSLDGAGAILSLNPSAERMFGVRASDSVGRSFESLVTSAWATLREKLGTKQETLGKTASGSFFSIELTMSRIDVGDRRVFIAVLQDITERKRVDRLKDEFVSTVSHELRTPLTSIRGSLGLISHGVIGSIPERAKGMLDIAVKNCDRLVGLVNDILDIEKIASGKMTLQIRAVDMRPLLAAAIDVNRPFAETCGVRLALEAPEVSPVAYGDPDRLMQVITNLVSNACKYSPRGQCVTLSLAAAGGKVRVVVLDHGSGIPEEFRSRVFQKFAQANCGDASTKKGTGLGLAISKAFIEKMGGTIGFETETGKGTAFHFELEEHRLSPAASHANPSRPRVLVCEGERNVAELLQDMLDRNGYDSDPAMNLREAKELLGKGNYAAIMMDLVLSDGQAVAFVQELRQRPETVGMPVIFVTASLEEGRRELGGQAFSIVDWLEKPISPAQLQRALERAGKGVPGRRARILHVEDDPDICQVVRGLLQESADVEQSGTVLDAWEKLRREDYDLLLLDVGLPDGSGLELLPALRKSTMTPIPSLVFSAHELSPRTAKYVSAALLKSKTSNEELVRRIHALLPKLPDAAAVQGEAGTKV